jgi:hypothetical protein
VAAWLDVIGWTVLSCAGLNKLVLALTSTVIPFCILLGSMTSVLSHVEAGKNTSTVITVSHKRRRKGNSVVSDETVMYGYESSATLTTDRLHYKLQTRPFVREGSPRRRAKQFSNKIKENVKSGHGSQRVARHQGSMSVMIHEIYQ